MIGRTEGDPDKKERQRQHTIPIGGAHHQATAGGGQ